MEPTTTDYAEVYERQRGFLWGYCYRLSGDAAVADDLVQETFVRALESPPRDTTLPWRPWLVRVATNLAHDDARRSRRERYVGPWLPSPIRTDTDPRLDRRSHAEPSAEGRYSLLESASIAFLLALEALTPSQRAVLLLRDVYDYSIRETADSLDLSAANVKVILHRARRALADYDGERIPLDGARIRRTGEVLQRLLEHLAARDLGAVEALLADGVRALSDGNGRYYAAKVPVDGADRVARLYTSITPPPDEPIDLDIVTLNHLPAAVLERHDPASRYAPLTTLSIDLDATGRIRRLYSVLAPAKLSAL